MKNSSFIFTKHKKGLRLFLISLGLVWILNVCLFLLVPLALSMENLFLSTCSDLRLSVKTTLECRFICERLDRQIKRYLKRQSWPTDRPTKWRPPSSCLKTSSSTLRLSPTVHCMEERRENSRFFFSFSTLKVTKMIDICPKHLLRWQYSSFGQLW